VELQPDQISNKADRSQFAQKILKQRMTILHRERQIDAKLVGGLGNQLFVYFAALYLAHRHNCALKIDLTDISQIHARSNIQSFKLCGQIKRQDSRIRTVSRLYNRFTLSINYRVPTLARAVRINKYILLDSGYETLSKIEKIDNRVSIRGYFQDFRYLDYLIVNRLFQLSLINPSPKYKEKFEEIEHADILGIHVRRGDFVLESKTHGCLTVDWYERAVEEAIQNGQFSKVLVFTNDKEWCLANISPIARKFKLEIEYPEDEFTVDPAESLCLMIVCKGLITANSTFSLLAGYFCMGKVYSPSILNIMGNFQDLEYSRPHRWKLIESDWE
jgi:hypothetical protein